MKPASFRLRFPLLAASLALLILAVWAGLLRIGWVTAIFPAQLPIAHGPLMICGFLGTLIALERAVALGRRWTYAGPALSAAGGLLIAFGGDTRLGAILILLASASFSAVGLSIVRTAPSNFTRVMALGAASWLAGNLLWLLGRPIALVVYWWAGFLLLTIAGERLELGRLLRPSRGAQAFFALGVALLLAGSTMATAQLALPGALAFDLGLLVLATWFLTHDVVRVTLRMPGLPRYIAVALGAGYIWLLAAAGLGFAHGPQAAGFLYDAYWHAIFVGFVLSMIFAHGPIILPAILGRTAVYHPVLYAPLAALHISLLLRVAGDLLPRPDLRMWGGLLNGVAILLFFISMVVSFRRGKA